MITPHIQIIKPEKISPALLEIPQPPLELYFQGKLPDPRSTFLTVVGSRKFSTYGKEVCQKLIQGLAGYPIVIVSGLALGIDTIAHETALESGLTTLAFPGSGLDEKVLYPRSNIRLAQEIIEKGGALVSEFEPDFRATPYSFPQRNRLMAGLSQATLIIEASEKSGTLITARMALDYNREILAVPGSIFQEGSTGPNRLIRDGATAIRHSRDILSALGFETGHQIESNPTLFDDLSELEQKICHLLSRENLPRDTLIELLSVDIQIINSTLSIMEIKGLIRESAGEFRLC